MTSLLAGVKDGSGLVLAKSISRAPDYAGIISAASVISAALDLIAKYEIACTTTAGAPSVRHRATI
jgi:hypothetical protein